MNIPAELAIRHNPTGQCFHVDVDGHQARLEYRKEGPRMVITHTGVPAAIGGKGIAGALTVAALDYARAAGLKVVPACEYAAVFLRRHDEYADLVE
ncbi:GNAT family N-acetyltransferase [Stenotrophomonas sp. YIM B06876]|uniref:GNAT family N-acetyltransferase n=1 Tax=Stenotrophomonas sp. YIM B06876 TaxID=3060211 RepID=UPI002739665D|nr:GNAT family N-acetyltransferase [Stenotrophomonas sp. YIM B06876]